MAMLRMSGRVRITHYYTPHMRSRPVDTSTFVSRRQRAPGDRMARHLKDELETCTMIDANGDNATPQELRPYTGDVAPDADPSYDPDRDPTVRAIGVMGAAGGVLIPEVRRRCYVLGAAIARAGCVLVTGAC